MLKDNANKLLCYSHITDSYHMCAKQTVKAGPTWYCCFNQLMAPADSRTRDPML